MFKYYKNKYGIEVPRVNEILRHIGDSSGLCSWANYLGFKKINYNSILNEYSSIGSYAHNMINSYINNNDEYFDIDKKLYNMATNAYSGFKVWFDDISKNNDVKVLFSEYTIVGDEYGGTIDALIEINGKLYLADFKTSNDTRIEHILQLCAYKELLKEVENIEIDGMMIIKSDKNISESYTEYMILDNNENSEFISICVSCFRNALAFYKDYKASISIFNEKGKFMIK